MEIPNPIRFSIITPVFNGELWITETVNSVLRMTNAHQTEYIVVNDGSSDSTKEILEGFENKITLINQENQGEAAAINHAFAMASGEYVLVVSADDPMISPDLLFEASKIMDFDERIVCTYPNWQVIDHTGDVLRSIEVQEFSMDILLGENICIVGPGGVFRLKTAQEILGRDVSLVFTSDYEFWLRLAQKGSFKKMPFLGAQWRQHENSTSIRFRGREMAVERVLVIERYIDRYPVQINLAKKALSFAYYNSALLSYFDKTIPAKRQLGRALKIRPKSILDFNLSVMLYILLAPFSRIVLRILGKFHLFTVRVSRD